MTYIFIMLFVKHNDNQYFAYYIFKRKDKKQVKL